MRSRVIPAQITTVEDKIAGNLSLTQLLILMTPVFVASFVYAVLPPAMDLAWYKGVITIIALVTSLILALRVKGKVVAQWLVVLLRFNARPKYYVFNKNESYSREKYVIDESDAISLSNNKNLNKTEAKSLTTSFEVSDLVNLESLLASNSKLRFRSGKKGGLNVAFEQISK